jgi:hypothetical protein
MRIGQNFTEYIAKGFSGSGSSQKPEISNPFIIASERLNLSFIKIQI